MTESAAAADTLQPNAEHFDVLIVGAGISGIGGAWTGRAKELLPSS
jgi:glycerol-3-phosphate dehydrogenase